LDAFAETLGIHCSDADFRQYIGARLAFWYWDESNGTAQAAPDKGLPGSIETDNRDRQPGRGQAEGAEKDYKP